MSLSTLLSLSGVPGLEAGFALLTTTYQSIEHLKLYKQQCRDMRGQCMEFLEALDANSKGLEGTRIQEIADELEPIILRMNRQVKEWGSWNRLKSFLQQREIKDGIDRLNRDLNAAMRKYSFQANMEIGRGIYESKAIQERDNAEIRELLQVILRSQDDMKALLNMDHRDAESRPVEEMMGILQTQLMDPDLQPRQEEIFQAGLWMLHESTSKLPPLTDLSGQISRTSKEAVVEGYYNDIFMGRWLGKEKVALRLPKALADNPEVQNRLEREVAIWRELDHSNIVPLYGIVYLEGRLHSVSPWMENGNIVQYVKKIPSTDRLKLISDIASGLEYLHCRGIVHGDLRGANVLISQDGVARLSDFGLSKFLEDCGQRAEPSNAISLRWSAPELVRQDAPVSMHSDVWSFAMVCIEILSGEYPFGTSTREDSVRHDLERFKHPDRPGRVATSHGLSTSMWELMRECWSKKPDSRPSISSIKQSLLEIRGAVAPIDTRQTPSKRFPSFSMRRQPTSRPSTAESDISVMSSTSGHRPRPQPQFSLSATVPEESSSLSSSISITIPPNPSRYQPPPVRPERRQGSHSSYESTTSSQHGRIQSPRSPPSPSVYSTLSNPNVPTRRSPRLEIPEFSTSLPSEFSTHFPSHLSAPLERERVSPIGSSWSVDSGVHMSEPLREALRDRRPTVNIVDGAVSSGTMEGLVSFMITTFNSRRDSEFRDIFLTACADFSSAEELFGTLSSQFYKVASDPDHHPEERVATQYNIFMVLAYWIRSQHLPPDQLLLGQMYNFCETASRLLAADMMIDKARELQHLVDGQLKKRTRSFTLPLALGLEVPEASQIRPWDLAVGLALLEGDKYKALCPSDYIVHLTSKKLENSNVAAACTTNNKIIAWVKDSVLHYEKQADRVNVLKFFIHTALECRKMRNFSSFVAIATALHSTPVENLKFTKAALPAQIQKKLDSLYDVINPAFNHRGYRDAVNQPAQPSERDCCIPWLAVHLKELRKVIQAEPVTIRVDGAHLINFERYTKFMDRIKEIVHYKPPDLEQHRYQGQLAYLEVQLRSLKTSKTTDDELLARSKVLAKMESQDFFSREPQLKMLGFRVRR